MGFVIVDVDVDFDVDAGSEIVLAVVDSDNVLADDVVAS